MRARNVLEPPDTTRSPDPSTELPLIVLMFVQDTRVACFQASQDVRADVSALSVLSAVKLSLIFHLVINQVSLLFRVCNVDIVLDYWSCCINSSSSISAVIPV